MAAEFINLLKLPELDIGHSKKVLFTSDHFHTWVHGDYPGTKGITIAGLGLAERLDVEVVR